MLIDLSVLVTEEASQAAFANESMAAFGHLGTHFDIMNKEFPISYLKREGIVFNVKGSRDEEINERSVDLSVVRPDMFVAFYSGFGELFDYGTKAYFSGHPQLSNQLIAALLAKRISIIGIDFAGIRRGPEHTPKDQYCADRGVFIVENMCNLDKVIDGQEISFCIINTYPLKFAGLSGLPCRVVAEVQQLP